MPADQSADSQGVEARDITLETIYASYRRPIHSYAYRLLGSQEDADDVTQEVFVRACSAWDNLYEHERLSSWLYRIATNLCVDLLRRRKRISWRSLNASTALPATGEDGPGLEFSEWLADNGGIPEVAERELIRQALAHIPMEYAIVLVLHAAQGVPYQEIAHILDISPGVAATRISRAKKKFIEQYQRLNRKV